jgi:predicted acylesterase/phospholipase RssA
MLSTIIDKFIKRDASIETYKEWYSNAVHYDKAHGLDDWRHREDSDLYDHVEIRYRLNKLRTLRAKNDHHGLLFVLNEGIHGNMGGMGNPKLYGKARSGTKQLIIDYVDEISDALVHIATIDNNIISFEEKVDFFHRASHCFGRSALMLSGGGQLGNFHLGVLKSLIEENLLPNVVSGSSAGSIFAALVGTYTEKQLKDFFQPERLHKEIFKEAGIFEGMFKGRTSLTVSNLEETLARLIPNLTFQEAYELTRRNINISIAPKEAHQRSRLLNAFASPNVLIRSGVMASCAIPGVFPPVTLFAKNKDGEVQPYLPNRKWVDGSMFNDLPSKRLTRMYGVNHFIVSMTNPFVLPFVRDEGQGSDTIAAIRRFSKVMVKETTQLNYSMAKKLFKYFPKLALAANNINSVVQQDYTGDINIIADFSVVKPGNLLNRMTFEELTELIRKGEQAAWPKIEAIRTTTKVGRLLDEIIDLFEEQELMLANRVLKRRPRTKEEVA